MALEPIMHLKPGSRTHSLQCGCMVHLRNDGRFERWDCENHARAFRFVCSVLASGRTVVTQRELRRAVLDGRES